MTSKKQFFDLRKQQIIKDHHRPVTAYDDQASEAVWAVAQGAEGDKTKAAIYSLSLPTGAGKSMSSVAYCAARYKTDPSFSCGIFVNEIREAVVMQKELEKLVGECCSKLWSHLHRKAHRNKRIDDRAKEQLGQIPERLVSKHELSRCRVIFGTHHALKNDIQSGRKNFTHYKDNPRSICFVDEHPELAVVASVQPRDIVDLFQLFNKYDPEYEGLSVLRDIASRMMTILNGLDKETPEYSLQKFVSSEESEVFEGMSWADIFEKIKDDQNAAELVEWALGIIHFLQESAAGSVFLDRRNHLFVSSRLSYNPGKGAFVVLDATADVHGMLALLGSDHKAFPNPVDIRYDHLETTILPYPSQFRKPSDAIKIKSLWDDFGKWHLNLLRDNTQPGDKVLLISHKSVYTSKVIPFSLFSTTSKPTIWEGREVYGLNWGAGLGSNSFKECNVVVEVGVFHIPRHVLMAQCHAWSGKTITQKMLNDAIGRPSGGDIMEPQGLYADPAKGHLLRWSKQLVMRGRARQVDENGVSLPMRYVSTSDPVLLMEHWNTLYPGAPTPRITTTVSKKAGSYGTRAQKTLDFLQSVKKWPVSSEEFCKAVGCARTHFRQALAVRLIEGYMIQQELDIKSAREIGLPGKALYIVKGSGSDPAREYQDSIKDVRAAPKTIH